MTKIDGFDDLDIKIINHLQKEGAQTNLALATKLSTSEATIRRRRTRLEEGGYIQLVGYSANPIRLGFEVTAIIGLQVSPLETTNAERALAALPEIHFLGIVSGSFNIMMEVWLRSNEDLVKFTTEVLGTITGIMRVEVFQFIRLSKYYGWTGGFQGIAPALGELPLPLVDADEERATRT